MTFPLPFQAPMLAALFALGLSCVMGFGCEGALTAQASLPKEVHAADSAVDPVTLEPVAPGKDVVSKDPDPSAKPERSAGTRPLRRLNREEYTLTFRDLLGTDEDVGEAFASDTRGSSGFAEGAPVTGTELEDMLNVIEQVSTDTLDRRWDRIVPCSKTPDDARACATEFVATFGLRAYRHPLSQAEAADLMAIYEDARGAMALEFPGAISLVLQAMLLSPRFHYRHDLGDELPTLEGKLVRLNAFEIASRLSYFLWQSTPDAELLDAAASGALGDPARVRQQAERMLDDPEKGPRAVRGFFSTYLGLDGLDAKDPVQREIREATLLFVEDLVLGKGDQSLNTLLRANYAFVTDELAPLYGLKSASSQGYYRVELPADERSGILTQLAFLVATSDTALSTPIRRGRFVFERLAACGVIPPLEGDIPEPPEREEGQSVRQQLAAHTEMGACSGCHQFMDPLGFAFSNYDSMGRFRQVDDFGQPADTSGRLKTTTLDYTFSGAVELSGRIADSKVAHDCFAQGFLRYALRTSLGAGDAPSRDQIHARFAQSGSNLRELILDATQVPSFYYREPSEGEVLP